MPKLGSQVPAYVLKARTRHRQCLTDINHHDPCTPVEIDKMLVTIAWNAQTNAITYMFTDDRRVVMDSELAVGGLCRLVKPSGEPDEVVHYMGWLIDAKWIDTLREWSGEAVWYVALHKDAQHPQYGQIVGFVQSRYLKLR